MDQNKIQLFMVANQDKLPMEMIPLISNRLEAADNSRMPVLMSMDLKSPVVALVLSLVLGGFGIDRFYIGDNTNGAIKLIVGLVVLPIISVVTLGIGSLLYLGYAVDYFLIMGAAKKKNAEKLMMFI